MHNEVSRRTSCRSLDTQMDSVLIPEWVRFENVTLDGPGSCLELRRVGCAPAVGLRADAGLHPRQRPPQRALRMRAHRRAKAAVGVLLAAALQTVAGHSLGEDYFSNVVGEI